MTRKVNLKYHHAPYVQPLRKTLMVASTFLLARTQTNGNPMGTRTNWSEHDSMKAYLDSVVKVGTLIDERRFGLFAIPEQTYRDMSEIDLAGLFTRVVPMEIRPMVYTLADKSEVNVLECLGLSKLFKSLDEGEDVPLYSFEMLTMGGRDAG